MKLHEEFKLYETLWDDEAFEVEKSAVAESNDMTQYYLFLNGKEVYASSVLPIDKALSEITAYIKKLTQEQKDSFSLSWEFDESEHNDYYPTEVYDDEDMIGYTKERRDFTGDTVVGVFSKAECAEYGYAFPADRFIINVDYAGEAIRKAFEVSTTADSLTEDWYGADSEVEFETEVYPDIAKYFGLDPACEVLYAYYFVDEVTVDYRDAAGKRRQIDEHVPLHQVEEWFKAGYTIVDED